MNSPNIDLITKYGASVFESGLISINWIIITAMYEPGMCSVVVRINYPVAVTKTVKALLIESSHHYHATNHKFTNAPLL